MAINVIPKISATNVRAIFVTPLQPYVVSGGDGGGGGNGGGGTDEELATYMVQTFAPFRRQLYPSGLRRRQNFSSYPPSRGV